MNEDDILFSELQLKIQEAKERLDALRNRRRLLKVPVSKEESCVCEPEKTSKGKPLRKKGGKKEKKKFKLKAKPNLKCFYVDSNKWKTAPRWDGKLLYIINVEFQMNSE